VQLTDYERSVAISYAALQIATDEMLKAKAAIDTANFDSAYHSRYIVLRLKNLKGNVLKADVENGWLRTMPEYLSVDLDGRDCFYNIPENKLVYGDGTGRPYTQQALNIAETVEPKIWSLDQSFVLDLGRKIILCLPSSSSTRIMTLSSQLLAIN
jgi:hypothetical protein